MKLVDEKGKLFGKLNIIDLLAILVLIAAVIFAAVRFLGPSDGDSAVSGAKLTYTAMVGAVEPDVYAEVLRQMEAAGGRDQLMANGDLVDAYVVNVEAVPHVNYTADAAGNMVRSEEDYDNGRLDVTFTIEANVPDVTTSLVGTQEVRVGKAHIVKTTHFEFGYSVITSCNWA